jgi:hypothetical protein
MNKLLDSENIVNENISEENENAFFASEIVSNEDITNKELTEEIKQEDEETDEVLNDLSSEVFNFEDSIDALIEPVNKQEIDQWDKSQIIERLSEIVYLDINENIKDEIEACKQAFYKIKKAEVEEAEKEFISGGGAKDDFSPEPDETEDKLKELLAVFRNKKSSLTAETEKIKETNLAAKKQIIEKVKELIDSKDDFYKVYNEFRKLQQRWKEIKQIPQASVNEIWKEYQHYSEKFYDLLKINNEMRDYDFKKNLELKQALCEAVEKLENEKDVISAFYQLQKLHQEWREIGPVSKETREEIWSRFKKACSIVNKRHQEHFESLRSL